jgi:2-iminobutanoate/2-iminopropanoate deaminase
LSTFRVIETPHAPVPSGPYSQALEVGSALFLAGQRPVHPETGEIPRDVAAQVDQSMRNVSAVLAAAGASVSDIVKLTVYLADLSVFPEMNGALERWLTEPYPVRTTVGVRLRDVQVEIDVIAVRSHGPVAAP